MGLVPSIEGGADVLRQVGARIGAQQPVSATLERLHCATPADERTSVERLVFHAKVHVLDVRIASSHTTDPILGSPIRRLGHSTPSSLHVATAIRCHAPITLHQPLDPFPTMPVISLSMIPHHPPLH